MKIKYALLTTLLFLFATINASAQSYDNLWKQVKSAQNKDLPKTEISLCNEIIAKATKEKNTGQLFQAYFYRLNTQKDISEDSLYTQITDLEKWAKVEKSSINKMTLHTVLAHFYASYLSRNRYNMPTDKEGDVPGDIREWTKIQFYNATIKHIDASLSNLQLLHSTKNATYAPFTIQQWAGKFFDNDMLHIITNQDFSTLQTLKLNMDEFRKQAINKKTIQIYNDVINLYKQTGNESAMILCSLDKTNYQYTKKDSQYVKALDQLLQTSDKANEIRSEIYIDQAYAYLNSNEKVKALSICNEVISLYPKYVRIGQLESIKDKILQSRVTIEGFAENIYPLSKLTIRVRHCNSKGFTLSFYKVPEGEEPIGIDIKKCQQVSSQHFSLQPSSDYSEKTDSMIITAPNLGVYIPVVINDENDGKLNNLGNYTPNGVRVSKLKTLTMRASNNILEVVVVDSKSGDLIDGAKVQIFNNEKKLLKELMTNKQGRATFETNDYSLKYKVSKGEDRFSGLEYYYGGYNNYSYGNKQSETVSLITDRSIYRPGQTVYIKGIAYSQNGDDTKVLPSKTYQLSLRDANNQEISKKDLTTNEFGSFDTQFVLPSSCLNGTFTISTNYSNASFKVEEYKRPSFEVTIDELKTSYSLGDTIHIKGKAKSFAGVPIASATGKYKVDRGIWRWWDRMNEEIIQTDSVKTDADGNFDIPIVLKGATENSNHTNYYTFNIDIDITNQAGETQSGATSLAVGERSLLLRRVSKEKICKDNEIKETFTATNLLRKDVDTTISYTLSPIKDGKATTIVDKGEVAANRPFSKEEWRKLPSGKYELCMKAKDSQGREVTQTENIVLFSVADKQPVEGSDIWIYEPNKKGDNNYVDTNHPAKFYFGTAQKDATILMDVFADGKRIESKVLRMSDEIKSFEYPYKEAYKNGMSFNFCFVKDGKVYQENIKFKKTTPDKELKMKWSVFRDKLRPGQKEEWKLSILSPSDKPTDAEMLAYMYDASLDKLIGHNISWGIDFDRYIPTNIWNSPFSSQYTLYYQKKLPATNTKSLLFDKFSDAANILGYNGRMMSNTIMIRGVAMSKSASRVSEAPLAAAKVQGMDADDNNVFEMVETYATQKGSDKEQSSSVRSNFAETAFFYPQLRTDSKGEVSIVFTLPESLTKWKFQGFAHTQDMMYGKLEGETTASKDFMISPNMPRFVRTGDHATIAATVTNLTDKAISANVSFTLIDPVTEEKIMTQQKPVMLEAKKSEGVSFDFTVTDRYDLMTVRMIAAGDNFSDGEEHYLPVLSDKVMLTESIPMPIRGNQTKEFSLEKLFNNHSKSATKRSLTVEFTGNPSWYAVQALPSLSLPESDNAISWATSLYANSLASYIANSMPRIKDIFEAWKNEGKSKGSLLSNLQKNQELKNILLSESPWVLEAKSEQEQKERLSTLFDLNNMQNNNLSAINKLQQLQNGDGGWSWYKGMESNEYTTEYVVRLMSRLALLTGKNSDIVSTMQQKGIDYLNKQSQKHYEWLKKAEKEGQKIKGVSYSTLRYLYIIGITGSKIPSQYQTQYNYFLNKVDEVPTSQDMQEKSLAAIILSKAGKDKAAKEYMASLKEHLTKSDELGEYFDFNSNPFAWCNLHINAHTAAIEAFDKVANDSETVEEMKLWLLKQKQTQMWDSPVSTADAIYALLERGTDQLSNKGEVNISFAGQNLSTTSKDASAGLGYIKQTYTDNQIVNAQAIKVEKKDAGIAWGAAYAQFTEDVANVKQQGSNSFNVKKALFVKRIVNKVEQLQPLTNGSKLKIGDIVTARLIIKLDRQMDFVQLKEQRAACFEPLTQLSGYHWGASTGYYEEIKDASTNFFFDSLQKGVYTLEVNYRVSRAGNYEAGLSTLQCAYAPEFTTHSGSTRVVVE